MNNPPPTRYDRIEYDPNDQGKTPWATYCPRRSPSQFKVHSKRAHATSAISQHDYGILFKWDDATHKWVEVVNWPNQRLGPPRVCDGCGKNLWVQTTHTFMGNYGYNRGSTKWIKRNPGEDTTPVFFCLSCR